MSARVTDKDGVLAIVLQLDFFYPLQSSVALLLLTARLRAARPFCRFATFSPFYGGIAPKGKPFQISAYRSIIGLFVSKS